MKFKNTFCPKSNWKINPICIDIPIRVPIQGQMKNQKKKCSERPPQRFADVKSVNGRRLEKCIYQNIKINTNCFRN